MIGALIVRRPDVHNYLQKEEMEERAKRDGKDDRSFFQKYVRSQNLSRLVFFLPAITHTVDVHIDRRVPTRHVKCRTGSSRRGRWRIGSLRV